MYKVRKGLNGRKGGEKTRALPTEFVSRFLNCVFILEKSKNSKKIFLPQKLKSFKKKSEKKTK